MLKIKVCSSESFYRFGGIYWVSWRIGVNELAVRMQIPAFGKSAMKMSGGTVKYGVLRLSPEG